MNPVGLHKTTISNCSYDNENDFSLVNLFMKVKWSLTG